MKSEGKWSIFIKVIKNIGECEECSRILERTYFLIYWKNDSLKDFPCYLANKE